ncbi:MAG: PDZ domain-containing protein [Phycisphaerae bacterium]|nr:PDZ domain-containing protein [Phycisphaerae bacterium]
MTEDKKITQPQTELSGAKESKPYIQLAIFAIVVIVLTVFAFKKPGPARAIALVALGFGGVVMIHELGHFLVAKLGGIKVETFSIGFPPVAIGIRKLKKGFRFRFLPRPGQEQIIEEGDNETEYQIGLIPLGGFVKMMGQSDTGAVAQDNDPRSFLNRPTWIRIAVVAAGVTFNAIAATLLFMALFTRGIDLIPAVVGEVVPNSPAYEAGLQPGDEIVEVNGERFVDYETLLLAPALSGQGQPILFVVRREGTHEETFRVVAEHPAQASGEAAGIRAIGISPAHQLTIEPKIAREPDLVNKIFESSGLRPGDEIKAVNNQPVATPWEFHQLINEALLPEVTLTVSRSWPQGSPRTLENLVFPMRIGPTVSNFREEFDLTHFFGMIPCLKVAALSERPPVMGLFRRLISRFQPDNPEDQDDPAAQLQVGDIIIHIGQTPYPNFRELRELTEAHKNKDLTLIVLRADEAGSLNRVELTVRPYEIPGSKRVTIGFVPDLAMDVPLVGKLLEGALPGMMPQFPPGAKIIAVDGEPVANFYEIIQQMRANRGQRISIDYEADGEAGGTGMAIPERGGLNAQSQLAQYIPFQELRVPFQADSRLEAISMGVKKVSQFIVRTLITLYRLIFGDLPTSSLMGPVGIITVSYSIADASLIHYLYFLGLLSSILAVMNLLPLPVLDGGVIVMLLIEKIIGRPISEKVQAAITYVGLALLLTLMLLVTYNDIIRVLFRK